MEWQAVWTAGERSGGWTYAMVDLGGGGGGGILVRPQAMVADLLGGSDEVKGLTCS